MKRPYFIKSALLTTAIIASAANANSTDSRDISGHTTKSSQSTMSTITEKIYSQIDIFNSTKNVDALSQALDMIDMMSVGTSAGPGNQHDLRTAKTNVWIAFFNALDAEIDSKFDLNDRKNMPTLSVAPPPEAGPSGIDPASIKDPALREQYLKSIEINDQKRKIFQYQMSLHKLDGNASEYVRNFISKEYIKRESDKIPLVQTIDQGLKSTPRKEDLKGYISIVRVGFH